VNYKNLRDEKLIRRITLDIDSKNPLYRLWAMLILRLFNFRDFELKRSPSGKGYHLVAWHPIGFRLERLLKIRRLAGDDEMRIKLDSMAERQIQVLFDTKVVEEVKLIWSE